MHSQVILRAAPTAWSRSPASRCSPSRSIAAARAMTVPSPDAAPPQEHHSASSWAHRTDQHSSSSGDLLQQQFESVEWIFGFGSLISHPGFEHCEVVRPCYIKGYRRVFWQGSTDHRGTPEAPGRTVTLEPCEGAITWGAAFRLAGDAQQRLQTWQYLEWREKQYDLRAQVQVYCPTGSSSSSSSDSSLASLASSSDGNGGCGTSGRVDGAVPTLTALTFIATENKAKNPNYLGPAPLEAIAHQIATCRGPSGPNFEYLFRLADAMRCMSVVDEELFQLEDKVRARLQVLEAMHGGAAAQQAPAAQGAAGAAGSNGEDAAVDAAAAGSAEEVAGGSTAAER